MQFTANRSPSTEPHRDSPSLPHRQPSVHDIVHDIAAAQLHAPRYPALARAAAVARRGHDGPLACRRPDGAPVERDERAAVCPRPPLGVSAPPQRPCQPLRCRLTVVGRWRPCRDGSTPPRRPRDPEARLALLLPEPARQAVEEAQRALRRLVIGHLVLEPAPLLRKGAHAVVDPLVAVYLAAPGARARAAAPLRRTSALGAPRRSARLTLASTGAPAALGDPKTTMPGRSASRGGTLPGGGSASAGISRVTWPLPRSRQYAYSPSSAAARRTPAPCGTGSAARATQRQSAASRAGGAGCAW